MKVVVQKKQADASGRGLLDGELAWVLSAHQGGADPGPREHSVQSEVRDLGTYFDPRVIANAIPNSPTDHLMITPAQPLAVYVGLRAKL